MSIAATLLIIAASTQLGGEQVPKASASPAPIALEAQATALILAGAEVRFVRGDQRAEVTSRAQPQIKRDGADTLWIEFS